MLEFDFLKRLGIEKNIDKIDCQKSYSFYDSNTNNLITELYLNKDYCKCEICDSNFIRVQKTFISKVKTQTAEAANAKLNIIISQFKEAHIKEYTDFIRIMNNWHDEIVNSFNMVNGHKITNGPMERVNKDIKTIIRISFGSNNFTRMRNRIMFCINENAPILSWRKKVTNKKVGKPRGKYKTKK